MHTPRAARLALCASLTLCVASPSRALAQGAAAASSSSADPLRAEIERWAALIAASTGEDEMTKELKQSRGPVVTRSAEALRDGRRLLALYRFATIRPYLVAATYVTGRPPEERTQIPAFQAEWTRLASTLEKRPATSFDGVTPAAVRALAEVADLQVRITYEASLDYGKSTEPIYGLFYLGTAEGQRDTVSFLRTLSRPESAPSPAFRSIDAELDALEREVLAAYRPPLSIDRHSDFIGLSSALKETRELLAAGFHRGALVRYLQAALRFGMLKPAAPPPAAEALAAGLRESARRFASDGRDHSIGLIFVESGEADLAAAAPGARAGVAEAVLAEVLPRYTAALQPARARLAPPAAVATITLVRWPYT